MKYIEVDEALYLFIASKTERIGESASDILRRQLGLPLTSVATTETVAISQPSLEQSVVSKPATPKAKKTTNYKPNDIDETPISSITFDDLFSSSKLKAQKGAVGRFLFLLDCLYQKDPAVFKTVLQVQGRNRLYFATSKKALLEASKSANPKEIGNSGYWVTTNNNTAKKQALLLQVLEKLGCSTTKAQSIAEQV